MNKDEFSTLVLNGSTVKELQELYSITRSKVYSLKKELGLIGKTPNSKKRGEEGNKLCNSCGETKSLDEFYSNGYYKDKKKYKSKCKKCTIGITSNLYYAKLDEALSLSNRKYKCEICGYCKNKAALCFHHINPEEKEFTFSEISKTSAISKNFLDEIDKCVILCHNCHMEEHYPHLTEIPL